ncbi:MAG: hypothetical protein HUK15_04575 [Bacteroidales bacterium]|nr:hypothetical protein [Bacteroidales bacterium]
MALNKEMYDQMTSVYKSWQTELESKKVTGKDYDDFMAAMKRMDEIAESVGENDIQEYNQKTQEEGLVQKLTTAYTNATNPSVAAMNNMSPEKMKKMQTAGKVAAGAGVAIGLFAKIASIFRNKE